MGDWRHPWEKTVPEKTVADFVQAYTQREVSGVYSLKLVQIADMFGLAEGKANSAKVSMVSEIAHRLGHQRRDYQPRDTHRTRREKPGPQPVLSLEEEEQKLKERLKEIEHQKYLRRIRFEVHPDHPDAIICYGVRPNYIQNEGVAKFRDFVIQFLNGEAR